MNKKIFLIIFCAIDIMIFLNILQYCKEEDVFHKDFIYNMESTMESAMCGKNYIREIYGMANCILTPDALVTKQVVKDEEGYLKHFGVTSFDVVQAADAVSELNEFCKDQGIEFAYISYPSQGGSLEEAQYYGMDSNGRELREAYLKALKKNEIPVLDMETKLLEKGYDKKTLFYKTDHHWKSTAGLFAAQEIAEFLNTRYDYELRTDLIEDACFDFETHENAWLGEQGRSYTKTWVGVLDDFTEIRPRYATSLEMSSPRVDSHNAGDFSILLRDIDYENINLYDSFSGLLHYAYLPGADSPTIIHNNYVDGKKILLIKDSFSIVVAPFLSLATEELVLWDCRITGDGVYQYIKDNDFDAVLVAYTDHWKSILYQFN